MVRYTYYIVFILLGFSTIIQAQNYQQNNLDWFGKGEEAYQMAFDDSRNKVQHLKDAISYYEKDGKVNQANYATFNNWANALADLFEATGEIRFLNESLDKYETAAMLNPQFAPTYFNWGLTLLNFGKQSNNKELIRNSSAKFQRTLELDAGHRAAAQSLNEALALMSGRAPAEPQQNTYMASTSNVDYGDPSKVDYNSGVYPVYNNNSQQGATSGGNNNYNWETPTSVPAQTSNQIAQEVRQMRQDGRSDTEINNTLQDYKQASINSPNDHAGMYQYGVSMIKVAKQDKDNAKYDEAFESLNRSIELDPTNRNAYTTLATNLLDRANKEKDDDLYMQTIAVSDKAIANRVADEHVLTSKAYAHITLGRKHKDLNQMKLGLQTMEQSLEVKMDNAPLLITLAKASEEVANMTGSQEFYDKSAMAFDKAMKLEQTNFIVYRSAAMFYFRRAHAMKNPNTYRKCISIFRKAGELNPNNINIHIGWAHALMKLAKLENDFKPYKEELEKVLLKGEQLGSQESAYNLICLYSMTTEAEKALEWMSTYFVRSSSYKERLNMMRVDFLTDNDFKNIKNNKRFYEILNRYLPA